MITNIKELNKGDNIKNWLVSKTAVPFLNKYLTDHGYDGIGKIEDIEINGSDKTITVRLALQGESSPVTATLSGYSFKENEKHYDLKWTSIKISRPWMENAAKAFLPNLIRLSGMAGKIISKLL